MPRDTDQSAVASPRMRKKASNAEGRGRDNCSPEICVDILVVGDEGYLVVPSACL